MSDFRFADIVAPTTKTTEDTNIKQQLNAMNQENLKIIFKMYQGITKFMANVDTTDNIQIIIIVIIIAFKGAI